MRESECQQSASHALLGACVYYNITLCRKLYKRYYRPTHFNKLVQSVVSISGEDMEPIRSLGTSFFYNWNLFMPVISLLVR